MKKRCIRCGKPIGDRYSMREGQPICMVCAHGMVELEDLEYRERHRGFWEKRADKERKAAARKAHS